ncbi:MAG: hypothetical protein ACTHJ3_19280 [Pararhizobium sp.]
MAQPENKMPPRRPDEPFDDDAFAQDRMGRNSLQGDDQANVHNQRQDQPDAKDEADEDVLESFEKLDKDVRAERELGKGNRSGAKK